ncbi:hypothetical protein RSOLAG22IIIB_03169 [Rhizoctonia solani]|uniref:Uncharacterized protein n=1 Tax=Rhizoctonia solani TaxID=456999 RepID=A0A0K6FNP3_9AGAM|nr:hypothetical protein RSOLAG22IIIB_03169 [Rhizoctonia solani]
MSPTPATDYPSTTTTAYMNNGTIINAAGGQPIATTISTGKKGLAGSVIAGAVIGGAVVALLLVALFFALRHRYRRSKGQTASTAGAPENENENEKEKCTEANESSSGHGPVSVLAYPSVAAQGTQSETVMCQSGQIPSPSVPRRSSDSSSTFPTQINFSNIPTHAPRPQSYQVCPCPSCVLSPTTASTSMNASQCTSPPAGSPSEDYQVYDRKSCVTSTSPPLPPGAMPPRSPSLQSYREQFSTSPPPQSPKSPGGSTIRRWIMSPLSRSESTRTALPPYEQPASGLQRRASDKKDESDLAAAVYTFM